jgi:large subunit ribosomal protein L1
MAKLTKKQKEASTKLDAKASFDVLSASSKLKEITNVNFDASVDLAIRLGVDPRKRTKW